MNTKDRSRTPFSAASKKGRKRKPKDKPKRPLSAYNYFFREEREKITRFLLNKDDSYAVENGMDPVETRQRMTENKKVKFEEVGKLIGKRWKSLTESAEGTEQVKRYTTSAAGDATRYKKELRDYNELKSQREAAAAYQSEPDPPPKRGRGSKYSKKESKMKQHADPMYPSNYPPSQMYGGGAGGNSQNQMYYSSSYPSQSGGPPPPQPSGSYPNMAPPPGGPPPQYSHHYESSYGQAPPPMEGRVSSYGSPSQYPNPTHPMNATGGGGGYEPHHESHGYHRPNSRHGGSASHMQQPAPSGYHPDGSMAPTMAPAYEEQNYEPSYSSQSQPYQGQSSHYPPPHHGGGGASQPYQGGGGGSYPTQSSYVGGGGGQSSWGGPGGYDSQKSQMHWQHPN